MRGEAEGVGLGGFTSLPELWTAPNAPTSSGWSFQNLTRAFSID